MVVAAGSGRRLGAGTPKAFVDLEGRPLLEWAVAQCAACPDVGHVIVVAPPDLLVEARRILQRAVDGVERDSADGSSIRLDVVPGGADRRESVAAGLRVLDEDDGLVLVHDAARALASPDLFGRVIEALRGGRGAVVPGMPVVDTIKAVDDAGVVTGTPDRAGLRAVQTPQGFIREVLLHAHTQHRDAAVTDDAGLVELTGAPIHVIDGDPWAAKITTADDLDIAALRLDRASARRAAG